MRHPHIRTGDHKTGRHYGEKTDPRFVINTSPGVMEPTAGVNELGSSALNRDHVIELRDELNQWLADYPTVEEQVRELVGDRLSEFEIAAVVNVVRTES